MNGDPTNPPTGRAQVPGAGGPDEAGASGRASAGGVPIGGVPVGGRAGGTGRGSGTGRASVGRATVGRASVHGPDSAPGRSGTSGVGRATVGRASVRPSSPSGLLDLEPPPGSDYIQGPGGPPPRRPVRRPASGGSRARRRRRNLIIGAFAAFIMIAGISVVGGTYYFNDVALPSQLALPQSTTIFRPSSRRPRGKLALAASI